MGKKRIAVLSKAQRNALRRRKEDHVVVGRYFSYLTMRYETVDLTGVLSGRSCSKAERLLREIKAEAPRPGTPHFKRTRLFEIAEEIAEVRPRLLDEPYRRVILALGFAPELGSLDGWVPPGKGSRIALRSLFQHLIGPFRIPAFLIDSLMKDRLGPEELWFQLRVADLVGKGGSIYRDQGAIFGGVPLTRRMCHVLLTTPGERPLVPAIRRAQVLCYGGDERLARVMTQGFFSRLHDDEAFWAEVIHWMCRQDHLDVARVDPLCDYLAHARRENPGYAISGRTMRSVRRRMHEWHEDLAMARRLQPGEPRPRMDRTYDRSGFKALVWTQPRKQGRQVVGLDHWAVREIITVKDLVAEGRRMSHCVASYGPLLEKGQQSIWTVAANSKPALTVRVANRTCAVVEARGRANRLPTRDEAAAVRRWAEHNNLIATCIGL